MDFRQLRYAIAVAEELSFTRAAERCHVSQPPLSRAIRELERELGARLFERDKHHVAVTPAGRSLVEDARRMLALHADSANRAARAARGLRGTLTLGFGGSPVYSLLPALVRKFRAAVPDVEIRFRTMAVLKQIDALRDGEIDLGIVRLPVYDELIDTKLIYHEPLIVAMPLDHPLLKRRSAIPIDRLATSRFVTYQPTRGFNFHADLQAMCRLMGFDPVIAHEAATTESVVGIVACGEGVAIVPDSARRLHMRGVAFRPLDVSRIPATLRGVDFALAWNRAALLPAAAEFVQRAAQ